MKPGIAQIVLPLRGILVAGRLADVSVPDDEPRPVVVSKFANVTKREYDRTCCRDDATPNISGKLASEFLRRGQLTSLEATEHSASFDHVVLIMRTLWDLVRLAKP